MMRRVVLLGLLMLAPYAPIPVHPVAAQPAADTPTPAAPKGPADIISGARKQRAEAEMQRAVDAVPSADPHAGVPGAPPITGGNPHAGVSGAPPVTGGNPHAGVPGAPPMERRPMSESREAPELATGSLRVQVLDAQERPVPGAEIQLGILRSSGDRDTTPAKSDASGLHVFDDLPVGDKQAYRVNVLAGGARFSSTPFRMPHEGGYHVIVRQLPTTTSKDEIVLYVGAASIELKDDRLKVAQQQRFVNIGSQVFVFPKGGLRIPLPKGFTAFQAQETMGDQHISADETDLIIEGSLPPGQTTVLWGFDVPIEGTEQTLELPNPWVTFAYRVLSDAPKGLTIEVDGFPAPERHESRGKQYWVTEVQRTPDQAALRKVAIHIRGIPGPGPLRWVAAAFALLSVLTGLVLTRQRPDAQTTEVDHELLEERRDALLEEARMLASEREQEAIGPEYYAEERSRLVDELSVVLWELDGRKEPAGSGGKSRGAK